VRPDVLSLQPAPASDDIPEVPMDVAQNFSPDRTDGRDTNYSFRDLFGNTDQASSAPAGNSFSGQWQVMIDGEEVWRFRGVGNNQADANRIAQLWLRDQRSQGLLSPAPGADVEVVPIMVEGIEESFSQGVAEGKLTESAIFLNPNTVIVGQQHGQPLELSPETLKKVQAIAAQHGAWYEGNGADRAYTRGVIDRYVGSFDDEVAKTASPNDPKWIYVLFANVDANNRIQRVGVDPKDTIFNRLMVTAQDNSFQGMGFTASALEKFLSLASEGKYDFVKMSQRVQRSTLSFLRLEILISLWVSSLVRLHIYLELSIRLTFLRGLPLPRPLVGGVRISPSGPLACFCFI
jgi:hypothetical protein